MHTKIVSSLGIFVCLLFFFPAPTFASDYATDAKVTYEIDKETITKVTYDITIENTSERSLQKGYDLIFSHTTVNSITAKEDGNEVIPELKGTDTEKHIIVHFDKPLNGLGRKKNLSLSFTTDMMVKRSGDIYEIVIPKLLRPENFRTYTISLHVPTSFGEEAYMVPKAQKILTVDDQRTYEFNKDDMSLRGVQATFGKFQVFDLLLHYSLKNDDWTFKQMSIALPPDTSVQKMYMNELLPKPLSINTDSDGNWIATYSLYPKESKEITYKGKALLFSGPRRILSPQTMDVSTYTRATSYWQTNDPFIKEIAAKLKTPDAIYRYVVDTLSYDYNRAKPSAKRLGASAILKNPNTAICMEFTDLFIALARSAGIPAREIEGFAQSDNPRVQPLSLSSDILHSWPEYWDADKETWIPVDPTWEKTTGGQDYFTTFDMKHIAFAIHGQNDSSPLPAGLYKNKKNTNKDVHTSLSKLEELPSSHETLSYKNQTLIPFTINNWIATITNNSPVALYNQMIELDMDGQREEIMNVDTLLPYQKISTSFQTPIGFLGKNIPNHVSIQSVSNTAQIYQNKFIIIFLQLGIISFSLIILLLGSIWFFRKK